MWPDLPEKKDKKFHRFFFFEQKKTFKSNKSSAEYHVGFSKFFTFLNMSNSYIKKFFNFFLNSIQNFNKNNNNKFEKKHHFLQSSIPINQCRYQQVVFSIFFNFFLHFFDACVCVFWRYFISKSKLKLKKKKKFIYTRPSFTFTFTLSSVFFLPILSFQLYESTYIRWCSGWSIVNSEKWKIWRSGSIISLSFSFIFLVILSISLFLLLFFIIFFSFNCWTNIYTKWLWWCQNINDDDDDEKIEIFISLLLSSFQFHH